jgi:hypothetical protein
VSPASSSESRPHQAYGDWRILLPPGWATLPTEREAAAAAVRRLLDQVMEGKPRDELVGLRIDLDRRLRRQLGDARRAGASYLHALMKPIRDRPVSASLIVVPIESPDTDAVAQTLHHVLGDAVGIVDNGYSHAGGRPALRRVRRYRTRLGDSPDEPEVTTTSVEYVVQLSESSMLLMVFSTMTDQVHEQLVVLFDAIADSLHEASPADPS